MTTQACNKLIIFIMLMFLANAFKRKKLRYFLWYEKNKQINFILYEKCKQLRETVNL